MAENLYPQLPTVPSISQESFNIETVRKYYQDIAIGCLYMHHFHSQKQSCKYLCQIPLNVNDHAGTKWRKIKHFQMSAVLMALSDLKFRGRPLVDVRCAYMVL